jgi:C_GCAxxG_C_C family probable redox protein
MSAANPKDREELLEAAFALGQANEKANTGCAQSTMAAVLDTLGLESEDAFRAASGMADGIGLTTDGSCGALVGGAMAIGLALGRTRKDFSNPMAAMKSYNVVRELHRDFIERYGSCRCRDIQTKLMGRTFDVTTREGLIEAAKAGMAEHCSRVVGNSTRKTVELILDARE